MEKFFLACAALCAAVLAATSCQDRRSIIETRGTLDGPSGEGGDGGGDGGSDVPRDVSIIDQNASPDACISTGVEICNEKDDDCNGIIDDVDPVQLKNDPAACGSCAVVCVTPQNAVARCVAGACAYDCQAGAIDVDKGAANGCECLFTGNDDPCDGRDNNCNGDIDDGFKLSSDLDNCGACKHRCVFPFAGAMCTNGACVRDTCLPGFFDRNGNPDDGCETACQPTNGGTELCDGLDNNCDGVVDNNAQNPNVICKAIGTVCAGVKPTCKDLGGGVKGWACDYGQNYEDIESTAKGCDDLDNDCDGQTDEAFGVGKACSAGQGACTAVGSMVCDPTDKTKTRCNAVPGAKQIEICNGIDDDCDGKIDELASSTERTSDDKLVYLVGPDVTMFAFEASRYDATNTSTGSDSSRRPCSVAQRLPWSNISKEEARDACKAIGAGWRLCTKDEWRGACRGSADTLYPYGSVYAAAKCNGYDYIDRVAKPDATTVATGSAAMCFSDPSTATGDKLSDMSGNVREWVFGSPAQNSYELRGGAYNTASFDGDAPGLTCDTFIPAPTPAVRLPSVGFRCCLAGRLP